MQRHHRSATLAILIFVASLFGSRGLDAQRPERQQEVQIPGTNLRLKRGWQLLLYRGCRFAVPGSWRANVEHSLATAPDGSSIAVRMFDITSWSAHKAQLKRAFGHVNVLHEDSERRLWFEIGDPSRVQHYVDVLNGLSVCSAIVEIRAATAPDADDTTARIIESVGAAPANWQPDAY